MGGIRKTEKKKIVCPNCGGKDIARIMYGLPCCDEALKNAIDKGEICLGGCIVDDDAPAYRCNQCGGKFGKYGEL